MNRMWRQKEIKIEVYKFVDPNQIEEIIEDLDTSVIVLVNLPFYNKRIAMYATRQEIARLIDW